MARVVIFDSGVGGLSIHHELRQKRPELEYVFVSDNAAYPYGTKQDEELLLRIDQVVGALIKRLQPDLVVIACNTASTVALQHLRAVHAVPFVGVVPAIKPAARLSKTRKIAVLGTPATARRSYTRQLVKEFAADCEVRLLGSSRLVELAEAKLRGESLNNAEIKAELAPVLSFDGCDTLVLACTHFPLLYNEIESILNVKSDSEVRYIIDSGEAIARRVDSLIPTAEGVRPDPDTQSCSWLTQSVDNNSFYHDALVRRHLPLAGILQL